MKRRYIGAPKWADYLAQALWWCEYRWPRSPFQDWAVAVLDRWCRCELCMRVQPWKREKTHVADGS